MAHPWMAPFPDWGLWLYKRGAHTCPPTLCFCTVDVMWPASSVSCWLDSPAMVSCTLNCEPKYPVSLLLLLLGYCISATEETKTFISALVKLWFSPTIWFWLKLFLTFKLFPQKIMYSFNDIFKLIFLFLWNVELAWNYLSTICL